MSMMATVGDRIIGVLLNKVVYKCDDANIVSFKEAVAELPDSFMWHILHFMDFLYKVTTSNVCCIFKADLKLKLF